MVNKIKRNTKIKGYLFGLFSVIFIVVILRVFFIGSFLVPSQSMYPTIQDGDYILVNKLIPGARIITDLNFSEKKTRPEIWRSPGYRNIQRNDVVVFNLPYKTRNQLSLNENVYYVKRCIAIPGDTFYIKNGFYQVNSLSNTFGNIEKQQKLAIMDEKDIPEKVFQCMPKHNKYYYWTMKNFGPLYIPSLNDTINISIVNINLYKNLIEYETGKKIKINKSMVYLNDKVITGYRFALNYYFMAGDNIFDSRDSRYWGLLPEDHIIGKAILIWKSKTLDTGKFNWKRFFKLIK